VQLSLHNQQLKTLHNAYVQALIEHSGSKTFPGYSEMLNQQAYLENLIAQLEQTHTASPSVPAAESTRSLPHEPILAVENERFIHVYEFHSPTLSLSKATRNVSYRFSLVQDLNNQAR
jgi:hypothetical protein